MMPKLFLSFADIFKVYVSISMTEIHDLVHVLEKLQVNVLKDRVIDVGMSSHAVDIGTTVSG